MQDVGSLQLVQLFQAPGSRHFVERVDRLLLLGVLQDAALGAGGMHGGAVGGHSSGGRDDARDACAAERADVQEVLAVHDDQVDEGHDLAHVGNGAADVHRAKCTEDAGNLDVAGELTLSPTST